MRRFRIQRRIGKEQLYSALSILNASDFKLLIGLTTIAVIEAITYSWIEVLLYTSDNPVLYNTWIVGHYTSYHLALALLVLAMIFGVGFVAWLTYSPTRFRKFLLLALGNFILWLLLEDEFTFIFSGAKHTPSDWTNWPIGAVNLFGHYVPIWYVLAAIAIFVFWSLGLSIQEKDRGIKKGQVPLIQEDLEPTARSSQLGEVDLARDGISRV